LWFLVRATLQGCADAAELARVVGVLAVHAFSDQDGSAGQAEHVAGPADNGEAPGNRGVDQDGGSRASVSVGECGVLSVLLNASFSIVTAATPTSGNRSSSAATCSACTVLALHEAR
jgi:hypothetical protein